MYDSLSDGNRHGVPIDPNPHTGLLGSLLVVASWPGKREPFRNGTEEHAAAIVAGSLLCILAVALEAAAAAPLTAAVFELERSSGPENYGSPRSVIGTTFALSECIGNRAVFAECAGGADLVEAHEPLVASDISGDYG
jgi:hypothetical protein